MCFTTKLGHFKLKSLSQHTFLYNGSTNLDCENNHCVLATKEGKFLGLLPDTNNDKFEAEQLKRYVNDDIEQMTENRMIFKLTEGRSVFKFHGSNHSKLLVGHEEKWNFTQYENRTDNQAVCSMTTREVNDIGLRKNTPYGIYWYKRFYDQSSWRYINSWNARPAAKLSGTQSECDDDDPECQTPAYRSLKEFEQVISQKLSCHFFSLSNYFVPFSVCCKRRQVAIRHPSRFKRKRRRQRSTQLVLRKRPKTMLPDPLRLQRR